MVCYRYIYHVNMLDLAKPFNVLIALALSVGLWAQPANDECANAIELTNLSDWCSAIGEYTNELATPSGETRATCFGETGSDVWFTFVAQSTNLNLRVLGDVIDIYGETAFSKGTMRRPMVALYHGICGSLDQIGCDQDDRDHIAELFNDELTLNVRYYIRVSSAGSDAGSFQLCISSFNVIPEPDSDCPTGVVLCDKSSFFVDALSGVGQMDDELDFFSCVPEEFQSAWYKWVAGTSGTLTFTITPNNPGDDLDFALFELPNGLDDCNDKILLRCMASGANGISDLFGNFIANPIDAPFPEGWVDCTGPTGLLQGEVDTEEFAGCHSTGNPDNNFLAPIQMEAGKVYALIVNNFSETGHGFSLEFGGTGEFLGPDADFQIDDLDGTVCFGEPVVVFDESSFGNFQLTSWDWNFGEGAVPATAIGPGPHVVRYNSGGIKSIALAVESETGCLTTAIGQVIVEAPFEVMADVNPQTCPESRDGRIEVDVISSSNVTSILWSTGATGPVLQDVDPGDYMVTITNFNGCDTSITYSIDGPQPLQIDQILTRPSCGGQSDGSLELQISGQAPPFEFDFMDGNGFTANNILDNIPADIYDIQVRDNNGCITDLSVPVGEIQVDLDPAFDVVTPPSCFGFGDGMAEIRIQGGGSYQFDFDLDGNNEPGNTVTGLIAGNYIFGVTDQAGCMGFIQIQVTQPDSLELTIDTTDISCFAAADGRVETFAIGGTGAYNYNWSNGGSTAVIDQLNQGEYMVSVTDANGCLTVASAFVIEPPFLGVMVDSVRDVLCFGDQTGMVFLEGTGGSAPFSYSADGLNFTTDSVLTGLPAGDYTITIRDDRGCTSTTTALIFQPDQLSVDAGQDTVIDLGFTAQLAGSHSPPDVSVTYQWGAPESLTCTQCTDPVAGPLRTTTYLLQIVDSNQCVAVDSVTVSVFLNRPVYIPNSITPNDDGINDRLAIFGGVAARSVRKIMIFDRWGEMVYEGTGLQLNDDTLGWDGTHRGEPMNPGVFVYVAEVEFIDDSVLQFEGDITLIR